MNRKVFVGTSGFSYSDWVGPYYPKGSKASQMLEFYSEEFPCVEINASFYRYLDPETCANFVDRTPEGFKFAVKLNQDFTHRRSHLKAALVKTLKQNEPFSESGKLAAVLAQFPYSFHYEPANLDYVQKLSEHFERLCIEFRCASWTKNDVDATLSELRVTRCIVDQPRLKGLSEWRPSRTGRLTYARFHGRNAEQWYEHEQAWQRYDYLYAPSAVEQLASELTPVLQDSEESYLFFNNHYQAQAVTNARQLATALGVPVRTAQPKLP